MKRLLDIELAKLLPSPDARVSGAIYLLLLASALVSLKAFAFELPTGSAPRVDLLAFPDVWHNAAYVASWIDYLLYVMVLQSVTSEYQFHTARRHVVDGLSRREYVTGKLLSIAAIAGASTLVMGMLAFGFGVWSGGAPLTFAGAPIVMRYGLQTLGYLALALLAGTLVRRTGAAVVAFIGYTLLAEPLLGAIVLPARAGHYLPSAAFASLVPNPFLGYAGMRVMPAGAWAIAVSAAYVCLLAAATLAVFERQDL